MSVVLLVNGLTLALALGFMIILLWHNLHNPLYQYFSIFLFFFVFWSVGAALLQVAQLVVTDTPFALIGAVILETGFTGSSVGLYVFTVALLGSLNKRFRSIAFTAFGMIVAYRALLIIIGQPTNLDVDAILEERFDGLFVAFHALVSLVTLFLIWRYRRKVRSRAIVTGIAIFVVAQFISLINPQLVQVSIASSAASVGALVLCFAFVQQEIIVPLANRVSQVESIHEVSLAISSQMELNTVLNEIARQATGWLEADAACITLVEQVNVFDDKPTLRLVASKELPQQFVEDYVLPSGGIVEKAAISSESVYVENYSLDWQGADDFPFASEMFGSVIAVPLIYAQRVSGVLMVICGRQGRVLGAEDVHLLELLGAQAAVVIAHSRSFEEQAVLIKEVEAAHEQLRTVLTSTDNPVVALDRRLQLVFANPAAFDLLPEGDSISIVDVLPKSVFPTDFREVVRHIRKGREYRYEILLEDKVYLCHLSGLGDSRIEGWVAVLNDITELKELDRMKSEMVRMASHDLKNPLMGAVAHLDLLRDELDEQKVLVGVATMRIIEYQLERMNRIISGILDVERANSLRIVNEKCNVKLLVDEVVDELGLFIEDKGVNVVVDIPADMPEIMCDKENLHRAFVNLIENAVKFTLGDGEVHICGMVEGDFVRVTIRDNGVGIPEDIQPHVFERFFRGQQRGIEHVTGSGLGLSFVKRIIEVHNGTIELESKQDEGTQFSVLLPVEKMDV